MEPHELRFALFVKKQHHFLRESILKLDLSLKEKNNKKEQTKKGIYTISKLFYFIIFKI